MDYTQMTAEDWRAYILASPTLQVLLDVPWKEAPTGHQITIRTTPPTQTWRKL